ncbi:hypothetical protein D3C81_2010090 [compost metagenome]
MPVPSRSSGKPETFVQFVRPQPVSTDVVLLHRGKGRGPDFDIIDLVPVADFKLPETARTHRTARTERMSHAGKAALLMNPGQSGMNIFRPHLSPILVIIDPDGNHVTEESGPFHT